MEEFREFRLPDVGEGLTEAELLRWYVAPGDRVEVNQMICEIETAKAAVELPCPYEGTVSELFVGEGDLVPVGTPLLTVVGGSAGGGAAASAAGAAGAEVVVDEVEAVAAEPAAPQREAVLVGYGVKQGADVPRRRARRVADPLTGEPVEVPTGPAATPHGMLAPDAGPPGEAARPVRAGGLEVGRTVEDHLAAGAPAPSARVRAKPPVRKLARDLGVELAGVDATGRHGDVTRADVERAARLTADTGRAAARPVVATGPEEERIPVRGVLRSMADAMVRSAFTAPHVTEWVDVDVTRSVELVARLRDHEGMAGAKVTPLTLVAAGLLYAVRRNRSVNATFDEAAGEIVRKRDVNLGIAVAGPRGLVVPNIKAADRLSLPELAAALTALTERARAGRTAPEEMLGGTITITNVGVFGVDGGTPILNPGEAAILAMGRVLARPWVVDGAVVPRQVMELTLSFDHRFVDGALGSRVLRAVADFLEDPALALALG
ncbi:MAG: dihydrolipoamide acetyltransferase family protein [Candidatus Nanopelagicales bacterium]